ncbi:MAG: hypothetical protein Q8K92_01140 [Leadbetterella sp.]|nr:hypothetical protein [Leadbetterella sp.]
MKIIQTSSLLMLLLTFNACQPPRPCEDAVVCETYLHRYGVPLDPEDWSNRGRDGQVIETRKNGVVVTKSYESGILHGECTYTFPHRDVIEKREIYEQGSLCQEYDCYINGSPKRQLNHHSESSYTVNEWYESGAPKFNESYENQLLISGEYYNTANHVESTVENQNGTRTFYNDYGVLISKDSIENGVLVSRTYFHPNGTPSVVEPYVNGIIEGERRTYLYGGEPSTIETWTNNQQQGVTYQYEHGEKVAEMPYVNGCKHGVERRYRDGSILVQEFTWVKGQRQGPCYSYIGDVQTTDWYFGDRIVNKATYDVLRSQ